MIRFNKNNENDINLSINIDSKNSFVNVIDEYINNIVQRQSINKNSNEEKVIFKPKNDYQFIIDIEGNNNYFDLFKNDSGFISKNVLRLFKSNSLFIFEFYDKTDSYTQTKLFTNFFHVKDNFVLTNFINNDLTINIAENRINDIDKVYMRIKFFNSKTGKINNLYNSNGNDTERDLYIELTLDKTNYKYESINRVIRLETRIKEIYNKAISDNNQKTIIKKPDELIGNFIDGDGNLINNDLSKRPERFYSFSSNGILTQPIGANLESSDNIVTTDDNIDDYPDVSQFNEDVNVNDETPFGIVLTPLLYTTNNDTYNGIDITDGSFADISETSEFTIKNLGASQFHGVFAFFISIDENSSNVTAIDSSVAITLKLTYKNKTATSVITETTVSNFLTTNDNSVSRTVNISDMLNGGGAFIYNCHDTNPLSPTFGSTTKYLRSQIQTNAFPNTGFMKYYFDLEISFNNHLINTPNKNYTVIFGNESVEIKNTTSFNQPVKLNKTNFEVINEIEGNPTMSSRTSILIPKSNYIDTCF